MRMKEVGVKELGEKVSKGRAAPLWVGATADPICRAGEYKKEYSENATMHYAKTSNMNHAENQLLAKCNEREGCAAACFVTKEVVTNRAPFLFHLDISTRLL